MTDLVAFLGRTRTYLSFAGLGMVAALLIFVDRVQAVALLLALAYASYQAALALDLKGTAQVARGETNRHRASRTTLGPMTIRSFRAWSAASAVFGFVLAGVALARLA